MSPRPTAIVTGASGAIGSGIARRFDRDGYAVVLVGRRAEALAAIAAELDEATTFVADLEHGNVADALVAAEIEADVLVHAAASYAPYGRLESLADADARRVFEVGPHAAMRLVRALLPGMKARTFGRVIFIGSAVATLGAHGQGAYTSAKAALVALARTVAIEGGRHGVTANVVEPGLIDTPRTRTAVPAATFAAIAGATPLGRAGTIDEVAAVVAFLASPQASFVTGAVVPVTGGLGLGLPRAIE